MYFSREFKNVRFSDISINRGFTLLTIELSRSLRSIPISSIVFPKQHNYVYYCFIVNKKIEYLTVFRCYDDSNSITMINMINIILNRLILYNFNINRGFLVFILLLYCYFLISIR